MRFMAGLKERINPRKEKDIKVLLGFVSIYCRENHKGVEKCSFDPAQFGVPGVVAAGIVLCSDCDKLLKHGIAKLLLCEQDPKPMCKKCQTHCYAAGYREKMREVMRFSGLYMIKHGRVDLIYHYMA